MSRPSLTQLIDRRIADVSATASADQRVRLEELRQMRAWAEKYGGAAPPVQATIRQEDILDALRTRSRAPEPVAPVLYAMALVLACVSLSLCGLGVWLIYLDLVARETTAGGLIGAVLIWVFRPKGKKSWLPSTIGEVK